MAEIHHLFDSIVFCNIVLQGNSVLLILNGSQSQKAQVVVLLTPQLYLTRKLILLLMNTLCKWPPLLPLQRKAVSLIP